MRTHVVRAMADVVATKLGIILSSFNLLFSQKGFPYDFESLQKKEKLANKNGGDFPYSPQILISGWTAGGVHALWVSKEPPWRTHIK